MERKLSEMEEELKVSSQILYISFIMNLLCVRKRMEEMLSYIELNNEETGHDFLWFYMYE